MRLSLYRMLGAGFGPAPLTGRDFKSLSYNGIEADNRPSYSSDPTRCHQPEPSESGLVASPFATFYRWLKARVPSTGRVRTTPTLSVPSVYERTPDHLLFHVRGFI